jgi:hypothetical protein
MGLFWCGNKCKHPRAAQLLFLKRTTAYTRVLCILTLGPTEQCLQYYKSARTRYRNLFIGGGQIRIVRGSVIDQNIFVVWQP